MKNPLRPLAAFFGKPHVQTGLALGAAAAIESNQPSLMDRPKMDQALVVAGSFASGYIAGSGYSQVIQRVPLAAPVVTDAVAGITSAAFAVLAGPRLRTSRLGSLAVTGAQTRSYASAAALTMELVRRSVGAASSRGPIARAGALIGTAAAADAVSLTYLTNRLGRYEADGQRPPTTADVAWTLSVGTGVAVGAGAVVMAERKAAEASASLLSRRAGGPATAWLSLTHALIGGSLIYGVRTGFGRFLGKIAASNSRTEVRYAEPPTAETVSGSPDSVVAFEDLGLQGRRFVIEASNGEQINDVMGESGSMDAIRVYVGVASAATVEERVALAIEELLRTGAFDRALLIVGSPAGTGYFNYIPVEAAEYLARGDVASVAIQYGSLPSMLSVRKIPLAIEQHGALLRAINDVLAQREPGHRPRVVLYGESLGAQTSQGAFIGGGTAVLDDLRIDRALWAGTPYAGKWRKELLAGGSNIDDTLFGTFASIDEYRELPIGVRESIRFFFLNHHEDPVTRFGLDVAYQEPTWLGPPDQRPPNVSPAQRWVPAVTFWQTAIDTKNAATVVPGAFNALGHDYRADLAQFVSTAYALTDVTDEQMASIEDRLRESEVERAARIAEG